MKFFQKTLSYGIDRQRVMQTLSDGTTTRTKRYFTPLYETVTENGVTKKLHYLTSSTGLFAIFASYNNGGGAMHYTLKDHQGNLTATIHGNTVERLSYDAWGRRRNPVGFGYSNVTHTFDRGYTLHEHYDDFDLINMNGRLYDPVLGRMLSPDIAIQDEHNAQAYNRYSYCFNNPLRFTDPSGYIVDDYWDPFSKYNPDNIKLYFEDGRSISNGKSYDTDESLGFGNRFNNLLVFGNGNPDPTDVLNFESGACVFASLGEISFRLGNNKDDAKMWATKEVEFYNHMIAQNQQKISEGKLNKEDLHGYTPKYIIDFINWTNKGQYNPYKAELVPEIIEIPSAYESHYQVLMAVDLHDFHGHAGVINSYENMPNGWVVIRVGDPSPIRRFKESYYLKPLHMEKSLYYYPPFDGRSMFIKVKSKKP